MADHSLKREVYFWSKASFPCFIIGKYLTEFLPPLKWKAPFKSLGGGVKCRQNITQTKTIIDLLTAWPNILYREKNLNIFQTLQNLQRVNVSKIHLVLKCFHVQSFVRNNYFEFFKISVFLAHTRHVYGWPYFIDWSMHMQTMPLGVLWPTESISGFSRPLQFKQHVVFMYVSWVALII